MNMDKQEINSKFNELIEKYNNIICMCDGDDYIAIESIKLLKSELLRSYEDYAWLSIDDHCIREIMTFHMKMIEDINFGINNN